jgi:phosphoribosyl-ATP pyrophosphohydrolase/phosphoribosyl-AMP cyclohydrolase
MPGGSYTAKLLERVARHISQKVGEEAVEVVWRRSRREARRGVADLLYHLLVLLEERGVSVEEVAKYSDERTDRNLIPSLPEARRLHARA